jgi:hypothetical protein
MAGDELVRSFGVAVLAPALFRIWH